MLGAHRSVNATIDLKKVTGAAEHPLADKTVH